MRSVIKEEECTHENIISIKLQWKNNNFAGFITAACFFVYPFQLMQSALFWLASRPKFNIFVSLCLSNWTPILNWFPFICRFNSFESHQTRLICCYVVQLMRINFWIDFLRSFSHQFTKSHIGDGKGEFTVFPWPMDTAAVLVIGLHYYALCVCI